MNINIRKTTSDDIDYIIYLHHKCFNQGDHWYRYMIQQYINNSYCMTYLNEIIGILLIGKTIPCTYNEELIVNTNEGEQFINNNEQYKLQHSIVMLCIDPLYQNKGFARILLDKYYEDMKEDTTCKLLHLYTRSSNKIAQHLYEKNGYILIGYVKDKYYFPTENALCYLKYMP
jgi:ribosomal protein S18 acetylase RimI-like enzyme